MTHGSWLLQDGRSLDGAAIGAIRAAASGQHRYLLLLSHMRSYSSVLAHVLGSSSEIEGYGETHVRYRNVVDLWRFRRSIKRATGEPLRGEWLLDKVLHNDVRPIDRFVGDDRVRSLIFLRRPERTLQSLIALARRKGSGASFNDPQVCCDYYVSRLHRLREDGARYGQRALYFDSEALMEHPAALLGAIGHWLGLGEPLSSRYRVGSQSGREGFGDWSENIRAGHLLTAAESTIREPIAIDAAVVAEAVAAYERCRASLLHCCASVPKGLVS